MADSSRSVDFDADAHPRRLNLGCGFDHREGYLNVDFQAFHDPDLIADARDLPMLPTGGYDEVVAQDVLEHLERQDVDPALREWARLLRPGGILVLRVPDVIGVARLLSGTRSVEQHRLLVQNLFGTQAYTGDYHHCGFTELTLRASLHDAGFAVRELVRRDVWMLDCVAERVVDPGLFHPGPLPLLALADDRPDDAAPARPTAVDRVAVRVAKMLPDGVRDRARRAWRPARRFLAERGVV